MRTTLSFTLSVRGGAGAAEFYKRAFGAVEVHRAESPDGDDDGQVDASVATMTRPRRRRTITM